MKNEIVVARDFRVGALDNYLWLSSPCRSAGQKRGAGRKSHITILLIVSRSKTLANSVSFIRFFSNTISRIDFPVAKDS